MPPQQMLRSGEFADLHDGHTEGVSRELVQAHRTFTHRPRLLVLNNFGVDAGPTAIPGFWAKPTMDTPRWCTRRAAMVSPPPPTARRASRETGQVGRSTRWKAVAAHATQVRRSASDGPPGWAQRMRRDPGHEPWHLHRRPRGALRRPWQRDFFRFSPPG